MGNARNIAFWVVLLILVMALFQLFSGNQTTMSSRSLTYSDFMERVDAGQVSKVTLDGERIVVTGKDSTTYVTIKPPGDVVT
ncbi:ATP-dependent metallopeptidase FtsH/Yme1/Tma family protein, partial [Tabrizicola sp.]|uniref:ATP-dependent metallopeptidase FtsH/Yme1/Tma family protein n=1 Tax=Tabrizicola sp. TaxID=2005166 RepID=UPI001A5D296B